MIQILYADTFKIGANIGNVPWEFQDKNGGYIGFEIDLVTEIAKRLKQDVEITNVPFNGLFSAVQSGRIDMAISSIAITESRLASVAFVQPYYDSDQSLTVKKGAGINRVEDLKGKVVAVDTGSTGDMWATAHAKEFGFAEIRRFEGITPAMLDLYIGRIHGYLSDIPAMQYYVKDKPHYEVVQRLPTGEQYSIMMAKGNPLVKDVNAVIIILKQEGFIAQIHEKWFGVKAENTTSTVQVVDLPKTR
ncbi:MAG: ABC transporter substrate-binding protein [Proteobacteria bacterium]|nr:ABC transporter substrate-binding protein [Pseudomonadota bacterium]